MKILKINSACLTIIGVLLLPGCEKQDAATRETVDKPRIAVIMKSLANEFFMTMEAGTRQHHAAHPDDYDLIMNGIKDESALTEQVSLVEQMIASGVDVIVLAPMKKPCICPESMLRE